MGGWVEILFPIAEIDDPQTRAWYVDGGANQSWSNIFGSGGNFAPGAVPHQIGTDSIVQAPPPAPPAPPPPPPPPPPPTCIQNMVWISNYVQNNGYNFNTALAAGTQPQTNQLDSFGNFYAVTSGPTLVFEPTAGNVISSMTLTALANAVDAWFGSAVVNRGTGFSSIASNIGFYAAPILQGQYILAYFRAGHSGADFGFWYVILQPSQNGNPTVLGAVYYTSLLGPPYPNGPDFLGPANNQTINDPILLRGAFGFGGQNASIAVLPSIAAIINGTYKANGFAGLNQPCRVPLVKYYPISTVDLSTNLFLAGSISFNSTSYNSKSGFILPNSSGGTNLYFYMSHLYMNMEASLPLGNAAVTPEVKNVLQPAYPNGCMLKINLGVIDYQTVASFAMTHIGAANASGTGLYTVDNASWNDGTSAQIPFADEFTYLDNGNPGGFDSYVMQPGTIVNRGNGLWWIIFYMPGISEVQQTVANNLYESVRVFQYNQTTEIATQIFRHVCILYDNSQIPLNNGVLAYDIRDWQQAWELNPNGSMNILTVNGYRIGNGGDPISTVYRTQFAQF